MNRADTILALGATAADLLSLAGSLEEACNPPGDPLTAVEADELAWAAEVRESAGACIAAINHLNGVSPE